MKRGIPKPGDDSPDTDRTSALSDTKWRKIFTALDVPGLQLNLMKVKFLNSDAERVMHVPKTPWLQTPRAFIDSLEFGPFPLRDIEWIEFPETSQQPNPSPTGTGRVPSTSMRQDVEKAEAILRTLGKFPMARTPDGLRIYGYLPPSGLG